MNGIATTPEQLQAEVTAANAGTEGATSDLARAFAALAGKQQRYANLWGYYDGDQPLAYSSKRLRDLFKDLNTVFAENWCAVVVDSLKDRVNLTGFKHGEQAIQDALDALWNTSELDLGSDDVHEAALVVGESFLIIWPDENDVPQAHFNDPRLCHAQYSAENPRQMVWAAKRWVGDDGKLYLTLYYPDRLEYYVSTKKASEVQSAAALVEAQPTAANPYGQIPVFHFRPQRRTVKGELGNVLPLQDAINKLLSDMMVAAEFGAFKQRWIVSQMGGDLPPMKNVPNEIWTLPAGDGEGQGTQVGEFSPTDLNNYLLAIDNLASAISTISRTPHHFFSANTGANLSGEALIALESPLNKKAQDRIDAFTPTWQQGMAFMLRLAGVGDVKPSDLTPLYDEPETVQPRTSAEITQMRVGSGMALKSALRMEGLSEAELEQIAQDQEEDSAAQDRSLGQAMAAAARQFDAGQPMPPQGGVPGAGPGVPGTG